MNQPIERYVQTTQFLSTFEKSQSKFSVIDFAYEIFEVDCSDITGSDNKFLPALPVSYYYNYKEGNYVKCGMKVSLTREEIFELHATGKVEGRGYNGNQYENKVMQKLIECDRSLAKYVEKYKVPIFYELRPILCDRDDIIVIDVDGLISKGDITLEQIFTDASIRANFPKELLECPFTLSRNNALPHFFVKISDYPQILKTHYFKSNAINVFNNFEADILINHTWEQLITGWGEECMIYNYHGNLPEINFATLQSWLKPFEKLDRHNKILLNLQMQTVEKRQNQEVQIRECTTEEGKKWVDYVLVIVNNEPGLIGFHTGNRLNRFKFIQASKNIGIPFEYIDGVMEHLYGYDYNIVIDAYHSGKEVEQKCKWTTIIKLAEQANAEETYGIIDC